MEIGKFISQETIKVSTLTSVSGLVRLEKLCSWLRGVQAVQSGEIEGFFELVMLLRHLEKIEGKEVNNGS